MNKVLLTLLVLVGVSCIVEAKKTSFSYNETHLNSNELGIQCSGDNQMSTRKLANMLIVACNPASK